MQGPFFDRGRFRFESKHSTRNAVIFSAVLTVIGAAVILLARCG